MWSNAPRWTNDGADFQTIGFWLAVADDEEPQLPFRRLRGAVGFALGRLEALREEDEVVDQTLHVPHHLLLRRGDDLGHIGEDRPIRQLLQALPDDPGALPHFLQADPVPVVGVA